MADDFSAVMDVEEVVSADDTQVADAADTGETLPALEGKTVEPVVNDGKTDWRKVPAELKEFFKTPQGKQAADAWFARAGWHEKFPGGTKEADEILGFLNEHGGREGLSTALTDLQTKAQELDGISEKMANGDPSLIADFVANSPEGFAKIAPTVLQEWSKTDFEGYNAQLSGVFAQTIASSGIPMDLQSADFNFTMLKNVIEKAGIGDNPLYPMIVEAYNNLFQGHAKIKEFAGSFAKTANTPVPEKSKGADAARAELDKGRADLAAERFDGDVEKFKAPLIEAELKTWFAKAPGDTEKRDAAVSMLRDRVTQALKQEQKDKGKQSTAEQVKSLLAKGDRAGALRIAQSRETILVRELAPKVGRIIYGTAEAPKPTAVVKPAATGRTVPAIKPTAGRFEDKLAAIWDA